MPLLVALLFLLVGCKSEEKSVSSTALSCKGIYYERVSGELKKFNQYEQGGRCLTDNLLLSRYETTQEKWVKADVRCTPQPGFASRTLVAANNYYDFRDNKAFLDFNSATGIYRRIIKTQDRNGREIITKLQGCYYERTGEGVDSSFGQQILLDTDVNKIITSQYFDPMEIFRVTASGPNVNMIRFDDTRDYSYVFCPILNTPWKFCEKLRDGNDMYFPVLPIADQTDLTNEAIIISKEFNWTTSSKSQFETSWNDIVTPESMREDYIYDLIHIPDTPRYISDSWREYVMGTRPFMPNVNSNTTPNICYKGSKTITMADGSTGKIFGEVCLVNSQYIFTQN